MTSSKTLFYELPSQTYTSAVIYYLCHLQDPFLSPQVMQSPVATLPRPHWLGSTRTFHSNSLPVPSKLSHQMSSIQTQEHLSAYSSHLMDDQFLPTAVAQRPWPSLAYLSTELLAIIFEQVRIPTRLVE